MKVSINYSKPIKDRLIKGVKKCKMKRLFDVYLFIIALLIFFIAFGLLAKVK